MIGRVEQVVRRRVSPTSIRSRILKGGSSIAACARRSSFTHVDPFEDTERPHALYYERDRWIKVSPTSIRSRILKEDESALWRYTGLLFHPRRSVRGY